MPKSTALLLSAAIVSSLIIAGCAPKAETTPTETPVEAPQMTPTPTNPADGESMMKKEDETPVATDGKEVTTVAKYQSPAGEEQVGFTLTVDKDGVITGAKTDIKAKAPISEVRQKAFAAEFETAVKGKKLADLTKIDRVGGSSLTTGAFNNALVELKAQM